MYHKFAGAAIIEAIEAQIELIVCITGNTSRRYASSKKFLNKSNSRLIGPNCPSANHA